MSFSLHLRGQIPAKECEKMMFLYLSVKTRHRLLAYHKNKICIPEGAPTQAKPSTPSSKSLSVKT